MGVSRRTLGFYQERLTKFILHVDYLRATRQNVEKYLASIPPNKNGFATRHASFRTIKTFYRWLNIAHGIPNPVNGMQAPKLSKPILPALERDQVLFLIEQAHSLRNKAIISLFTESVLRLSELVDIKIEDIDWSSHIIKVVGKGGKEGYVPFGEQADKYLREWLAQYQPTGNIWGLTSGGLLRC